MLAAVPIRKESKTVPPEEKSVTFLPNSLQEDDWAGYTTTVRKQQERTILASTIYDPLAESVDSWVPDSPLEYLQAFEAIVRYYEQDAKLPHAVSSA